jgi:hypothetical protein
MKWSVRAHAWRSMRRTASLLAVAAVCYGAMPQQAFAAMVQAYILFEIAAPSDVSAAAEKLRSTSLANCKQLILGHPARDVVVHIACDERGDPSYLNQAMQKLARVDGIARATIVSVKQGAD